MKKYIILLFFLSVCISSTPQYFNSVRVPTIVDEMAYNGWDYYGRVYVHLLFNNSKQLDKNFAVYKIFYKEMGRKLLLRAVNDVCDTQIYTVQQNPDYGVRGSIVANYEFCFHPDHTPGWVYFNIQ